jgi:hypothetical protein
MKTLIEKAVRYYVDTHFSDMGLKGALGKHRATVLCSLPLIYSILE